MNEQDTPELLPCPFCGGKPYTRTIQDEDLSTHSIVDWHFVGCSNCDVSFGIPDDYDCGSASEQWNTRAAMPDTTAQADTVTPQQAAQVLIDFLETPSDLSPIPQNTLEGIWVNTFRESGFTAVQGFLSSIAGKTT